MNPDTILEPGRRNKTFVKPTVVNSEGERVKKIGRNEPCPCPKGQELELKYKHCCGNVLRHAQRYDEKVDYSDSMGEKGVFMEMAEEAGITKDMKMEEVTNVMRREMFKGGALLLNKIHKKYNRTATIQPGMFSDVVQVANFFGGYCRELMRDTEDAQTKVKILEDQILKLKAGIDETTTVPEGSKQAS